MNDLYRACFVFSVTLNLFPSCLSLTNNCPVVDPANFFIFTPFSACGGAEPEPEAVPVPEAVPEPVPVPEPEPELVPVPEEVPAPDPEREFVLEPPTTGTVGLSLPACLALALAL